MSTVSNNVLSGKEFMAKYHPSTLEPVYLAELCVKLVKVDDPLYRAAQHLDFSVEAFHLAVDDALRAEKCEAFEKSLGFLRSNTQ